MTTRPRAVPPPPLVDPQIEHVVQEDVGQERADARPLRRSLRRLLPLPALQHAGLAATRGSAAGLVGRRSGARPSAAATRGQPSRRSCGCRHRAPSSRTASSPPCAALSSASCGLASRPEAVGETQKVGLVDGAQHLGHRALDDLVLQRRHAERPLTAVRFRDVHAPHRLRPVAPACAPARTGRCSFACRFLLVARRPFPIDSRTRLPLQPPERALQRLHVDMMQQRREPGLLVSRWLPRSPARGWAARRPGSASGPWPPRCGLPSGRPLPSARLVSFGGFIGTMNRSDSRPRLGGALRFPSRAAPVGDHADGPGRVSWVPMTTFRT